MKSEENGKRHLKLRDVIRMVFFALAIGAIVKELRKSAEDRTWHGALFDFVPYDFRKPSVDKVKASMWNPEAPLITPRVFGVGWTVNAGAAVARLKASVGGSASEAAA